MSDWKTCAVSDSFINNKVGRKNQIPAKDIAQVGRFPVVDQGQEFIAGYCDDENKVIDFDLPLIIFGDHTRCFKFVDFPFVLGADGTKVLLPNKKLYDPRFYFFALLALELPSRGYNRHFKTLKELSLPLPPLSEQKKIAHILSTVQRAIEAQERISQTTTELKKALMHKLFTEGLRNEPQKQTEIGLVPESWQMPYLGEISEIRYGLGQPPQQADDGVPMIRATNIKRGQISKQGLIRIKRSAIPESRNPYLQVGDVVVVRSGAYTGDVAMIPEEWAGSVAGYDLVVSPGTSLNSAFCAYALLSAPVQQYFKGQSNRAAQAHLNRQQLQTTRIPLPPRNEQDDIAGILTITQKKIDYAERRCVAFQDLFRTLLHKLMTAKMRIDEIQNSI